MSHSHCLLVVDDSPTQLMLMKSILESEDEFKIDTANNGKEALEKINQSPPDLVLTDLQMPEMTGLELVEAVKMIAPSIPVILTTSKGSEEIACKALELGAASYVPKRNLSSSLVSTVRQVMEVAEADKAGRDVVGCLTRSVLHFELGNDEKLIPGVISRLEDCMTELRLFDEAKRMQISMALDEALLNALIHGNLGIPSDIREVNEGKEYREMIAKRTSELPYRDRIIRVCMDASQSEVKFQIEDQGNGFDVSTIPDPTDPANLENLGGRGLLLINAFMDEVSHNATGNQIVLIKRVESEEEVGSEE